MLNKALNVILRILPLLAILLLVIPTSPAAADGELNVSVREVEAEDGESVQFLAKVVDQNGRPIPNLSPDNFTLTVDGQEIPVTDVQTVIDAQVGISALLVIDTSGSMEGAPLAAARDAAAQYIQSLEPIDEVAVTAFANGISVISEFSNDYNAVENRLQNLNALGNTALYDAVADAGGRITERENVRRVVILLSDGEHFGPVNISRGDALNAAQASGVPYYVIGLGSSIDEPFLQEVADSTDGAFFAAPSSDQLADLFQEIANLLRSEYVITADFSESGLSGETTALFRAEGGPGNGEVSLTFALPAAPAPVIPTPLPTAASGIPQPIEEPADEESGGGAGVIIVLLLLLFAAAGAGGWLFWRRLTRPRESYVFNSVPRIHGLPEDFDASERRQAPPAVLRLESGEEFRIEGSATLGVDEGCTYRLPLTAGQFGHGELRVWFANQRYLIHDVAPRPRIRVNGRPVTWSFLGEGDEIEIRGVKLRFAMAPTDATLTRLQ